ncbi:unnamed protein product [Acanthosepion pharaonis]|uniref:Uncharacterized protein n=1 Tax=Acanthosepion pharaonis TaxID=158019 RepID=A0A812DDR6_ACAPH|nr:unnamed protein product [Sepia pharaonis]
MLCLAKRFERTQGKQLICLHCITIVSLSLSLSLSLSIYLSISLSLSLSLSTNMSFITSRKKAFNFITYQYHFPLFTILTFLLSLSLFLFFLLSLSFLSPDPFLYTCMKLYLSSLSLSLSLSLTLLISLFLVYLRYPYDNIQAEPRIGILPPSGRLPRGTSCYYFRPCFTRLTATFAVSNMLWKMLPFLPFSIVIDADKRPHDEHERRYNAPACNEVAAIIHGEQDRTRDIVLRSRSGALRRISETHRSYDALL